MKIGNRYRVGSTGNVFEVQHINHPLVDYPFFLRVFSLSDEFVAGIKAAAEHCGDDPVAAVERVRCSGIRVEPAWFDRKDVTEVK